MNATNQLTFRIAQEYGEPQTAGNQQSMSEVMAELSRLDGTIAALQSAVMDLTKRLQPAMVAALTAKCNGPQPVDTPPTSILGNRIYGARQQASATTDEVLALLRDLAI